MTHWLERAARLERVDLRSGDMAGRGAGSTTVTLADVARRARVSPATASRVINGSAKRVTGELRERVLRAVAELRYVPNAHAQQLARAQHSAVGVILHDVSDPYSAEITRGLQSVAIDSGRLLLICNSYGQPDRELAYVESLRAQQVHAMVIAGSGYRDSAVSRRISAELEEYARTGGRVSVIGRREILGNAVLPDNERGGYLAGRELYTLGHTVIGVVAGPQNLTTTADRVSGVRRAGHERGHELPPGQIVHADPTRAGGAAATRELLTVLPGLTAVIALNDAMAVGALTALRAAGRRVPADVSVVGFGDLPMAEDVTPRLTTVRLPLVDMGVRAMAMALDGVVADRTEVVEVALVRRESCAGRP